MMCHICLKERTQTTHKGSEYCIRCLWREFPKLKEKKLELDGGTPNPKQKGK